MPERSSICGTVSVMPERSSMPPTNDSGAPRQPPKVPASKDPAAVALGRKGGLKGGKARAAKLSAEERSAIARRAAMKRWESR
jgi:hypothetical protein